MIKKLYKAFTLVELVVVIAIIAIISGVSIATYIGVTNNAKKSADMQLAKQMNDIVQVYEIDHDINTMNDLSYALAENGLYPGKPQLSDHQFMWNTVNNDILYIDNNYKVENFDNYDVTTKSKWILLEITEVELTDNSSSYSDLF